MYDEDDSESGNGWIQWFCDLEGHEFFAEVDQEYITDNFNLHGLREKVQHFKEAMTMIMRSDSPDSEDLNDPQFLEIYQSAMDLYGVIHARYILSPHGLNKMREKFLQGAFGTCPRVLCERQHVLPIGVSEELSTSRVKVYCPRCVDVYLPRQKQLDIDGAYFGASFPHVFLKHFNDSVLPTPRFIPKIYGFKIFGMRGSRYELKFDYAGQPINESEIREVLERQPIVQNPHRTEQNHTPAASTAGQAPQAVTASAGNNNEERKMGMD